MFYFNVVGYSVNFIKTCFGSGIVDPQISGLKQTQATGRHTGRRHNSEV